MTGQVFRKCGPLTLSAGVLTLALCCCLVRADGLPGYHYVRQWPEPYVGQAQAQVAMGLEVQAQNGLVLEQTIWNYHFDEGTNKLRRSGEALLNRLARRQAEMGLELFLQTARDVKFQPEHPEQYGPERTALDTQRMKAIQSYLASTHPEVVITLNVNDPRRPGMPAVEAVRSVREQVFTSKGIIPPELQIRLSAALKGEIPVGAATPTAAVPGTGSVSGAFGASE